LVSSARHSANLIYIITPIGAPNPAHANAHAVSPLFIIVYPNSAAESLGTMNCAHEGGDNCPDHGPGIADLARAVVPAVYGDGVWGHDHIMDGPGDREFNVAWHVVVVLFTNAAAAKTHITTGDQLDAALEAGDATTVERTSPSTAISCRAPRTAGQCRPRLYSRKVPRRLNRGPPLMSMR